MTNEQLKSILEKIDLCECDVIIENYIYYSKRIERQRCYNGEGGYSYSANEYVFLIITDKGEKQAIILRCGYEDLHWYVKRKYRGSQVLSNALRTEVIRYVWPENTQVTCCYSWNDNREQKYEMTKHLADIAGLRMK